MRVPRKAAAHAHWPPTIVAAIGRDASCVICSLRMKAWMKARAPISIVARLTSPPPATTYRAASLSGGATAWRVRRGRAWGTLARGAAAGTGVSLVVRRRGASHAPSPSAQAASPPPPTPTPRGKASWTMARVARRQLWWGGGVLLSWSRLWCATTDGKVRPYRAAPRCPASAPRMPPARYCFRSSGGQEQKRVGRCGRGTATTSDRRQRAARRWTEPPHRRLRWHVQWRAAPPSPAPLASATRRTQLSRRRLCRQ